MEHLISFAQNTSPVMFALLVIAGLVHIVIILLKNTGIIKKVKDVQAVRTIEQAVAFNEVIERLDKIAGNHLHGLPDMEKSLERIEMKQDKMLEVLYDIRNNTKK